MKAEIKNEISSPRFSLRFVERENELEAIAQHLAFIIIGRRRIVAQKQPFQCNDKLNFPLAWSTSAKLINRSRTDPCEASHNINFSMDKHHH